MRTTKTLIGAAALALLSAPSVAADQSGGMQGMDMHASKMGSMNGMGSSNMMGAHMMPATVTSVDKKTGLVEATSEGMPLKVHFPPASVANVKTGDQITLHLGFSKP